METTTENREIESQEELKPMNVEESLGIKSKEAMLDKLHEALYQPIEVV